MPDGSAPSTDALERWFAANGWSAFDFQREVWSAYLRGESGLVHSATGSGKTLAAWLGPLAEWIAEEPGTGPANQAKATPGPVPMRVLWLTPMRALAADTQLALQRAVDGLGLPWTVGLRTGDTSSAERAKQARRLPSALVTTPESLSLLLSDSTAREKLSDLRLVVVDEWHELLGSKRGVMTELALARLRRWNPRLRIWGLSATLGNIDEALERLVPSSTASRIVRGASDKQIVMDTLAPPEAERFPWAGHVGLAMLDRVIEAIDGARSTLVFTNVRSAAEAWYQGILEARPEWAGIIGLHHGSLDADVRRWVEEGLKEGRLKAVVATSSLDLGVDFSPVDRVLQIGSPKGVARLLQRAGRSGHAPGQVSRVTCVPSYALEFVEAAAVRRAARAGRVEARQPVDRPLDLLTQHLVTIAVGEGFEAEAMQAEVRSTRAYRDLSDAEWQWALDFVTRGGEALRAYPEYHKVERGEDGIYRVKEPAIARRHRMSIGTIVSDAAVTVKYVGGGALGSVEESFIARLNPGDKFIFAGKPLEFVRVRDMVAWVRRAENSKGAIPRWMGARMPLSTELAASLRGRLEEASRGIWRDPEMEAIRPILEVQARWSRIPAADELLIERVKTREGHHLFFFPFEGRLVHEGLAALFAYRISRLKPISFTFSMNDYGFELLSPDPAPIEEALEAGLLAPHNLLDDVPASLNATEMARRQFREIARVAGLVFQGFPYAGKTARQLQASSGLFFDVFTRYDPGNLLVSQAHREVLERQLESSRLGRTLDRLAAGRVALTEPKRTPPLAFPLLVDRTREAVSSESMADRVRRMQVALEKYADAGK